MDKAISFTETICPNCSSENLNYKSPERTGEREVQIPFHCRDCGKHYLELYTLVYDGTIEKEK